MNQQSLPTLFARYSAICIVVIGWACLAKIAHGQGNLTHEEVADSPATDPAPAVYVKLTSGREFTAVADPRSDANKLWLRFEARSTKILRPVNWDRIEELHVDGVQVPLADFREHVQDFVAGEFDIWELGPDDEPQGMSHAEAAQFVLGTAPRVASISADISLGHWDADVEPDGLLVTLHPTSAQGWLVPAAGTLQVTLFAPRRSNVNSNHAIRQLGRWSIPVRAEDFLAGPPRYKLPFQAIHPEFDVDFSHLGLANVKFVSPGSGVFEVSSAVRIREFNPLRDWLQRDGKPRFLPSERVGQ